MIIFGTTSLTRTGDKGTFHCPSCGAGTRYEQKRVRRFFTLYFIPLVPLDVLAEYIECQGCKGTYEPNVLSYDPEKEAARIRTICEAAALRVMVRVMAADGRIADEEVETIRNTYRVLCKSELTPNEVAAEGATMLGSEGSIANDIVAAAPYLNNHGREVVVRAALLVAQADGELTTEESNQIVALAKALEVTPAHLSGIIDELTAAPGQ